MPRVSAADDLPPGDRIVTIGTFDGVHRGHRRLLAQAVQRGDELGLPVTGVTFEPVPAAVLRPDAFSGRISTPEDKLARLAEAGLDEIVVVPFTPELSRTSPEAFMQWLQEKTGLRELWVGEEFALGKDRAGTVERLTAIGEELGFRVVAVPRLTNGAEVVSSSRVRAAVMSGDVATARRLLGRPFRVEGEVVHGQHLGRTIGFPTANVAPPPGVAPLADGIYAAWAWLPGDMCRARPSPMSAAGRPSTAASGWWRRTCSTSTATSTGRRSSPTSSSASVPTSASTPSTTSSPRCGSTRRRRGRSWRAIGWRVIGFIQMPSCIGSPPVATVGLGESLLLDNLKRCLC